MDKEKITFKFRAGLTTYCQNAIVQREMAHSLGTRLCNETPTRHFPSVFEFGCGAGLLTQELVRKITFDRFLRNDLVPECAHVLPAECRNLTDKFTFACGDIEHVELTGTYDLIASNATIQWIENLEGLLEKLENHLAPFGWIIISTFAPGNLQEIAETTGVSLQYPPVESLQNLWKKYFKVVDFYAEKRVLFFQTIPSIFRHLRDTGVTETGEKPLTAKEMRDAFKRYETLRGIDGKYPLTYQPVYLIGRKKIVKK